MNELKKALILNASRDIIEYLDEKYGIEVDIYDIADFINLNLGFVFQKIKELEDECNEFNQRTD